MGRLFPGLENLGFQEIWGLDVSAETIALAEEMCPVRSAHFVVGTGDDLTPLEDNYFYFCHSYVVFEHIPTSEIIWRYFEEMERILAPGGAFAILLRRFTWRTQTRRFKNKVLYQLPGPLRAAASFTNWALIGGWMQGLPISSSEAEEMPGGGDRRWCDGAMVTESNTLKRLPRLGMVDLSILPDPTTPWGNRFWVIDRKSGGQQ